MEITYSMLVPVRLLATYKDRMQTFGKPTEAEDFARQVQEEMAMGENGAMKIMQC